MGNYEIHLIGNAHIDPVWLWRFPEGLAEVKATFKAALDRIREHDSFIFTCASAFYYKWVEENCPEMFEQIRTAVKNGRWCIVGGMWVQPDCNIPSGESLARHLLYSQNYFEGKFGIRVRTGYNVDTFGHSGCLPGLLNEAGIENYVYMRPDRNAKDYGFDNQTFRWRSYGHEVVASKIGGYGGFISGRMTEQIMRDNDEYVEEHDESIMKYYGCGNHGGGPTVRSIQEIDAYLPKARNTFLYSDPNRYFDYMREKHYDDMPVFQGELKYIFGGCYSANAKVKALNRQGENRMNEAERMEVLANACISAPMHRDKLSEAWQTILFNQFHDIICGCSVKAAYRDVYAFGSGAIASGLKLTNEAAQRISWSIDTAKKVPTLSKDQDWIVWDNGEAGAPVVVFNPLSHPVTVPVYTNRKSCTGVMDEKDNLISCQTVPCVRKDGCEDAVCALFLAEVPPYGYRTFRTFDCEAVQSCWTEPLMKANENTLCNDRITVTFDREKGCISSIRDRNGKKINGNFASKAVVIDDRKNDTWGHDRYIFDEIIGEFGDPEFTVVSCGACEVALKVTTRYKTSYLTQIYTLYAHDERIHVAAQLLLNEPLIQVKILFDSGLENPEFIREIPGGIGNTGDPGYEEPMLRFMAAADGENGLVVVNDCKHSASLKDGVMAFVAARSCYYADHRGIVDRDAKEQRMVQDMGEQEFCYDIIPWHGDLAAVFRAAEEINTEFPVIPETYHNGTMPESLSCLKTDSPNVTVTAIKSAEDDRGYIVRLMEIGGKEADVILELFGTAVKTHVRPFDIQTFRFFDGEAYRTDLTEK